MPQVKFEKSISLTPYEAFEKLKGLTREEGEGLKRVDPGIVFDVQGQGRCIAVAGQKVNGTIKVLEEDGQGSTPSCRIEVDISIIWALVPFKGMIKAKLEEEVDRF